ncbi:fatty acyl-AMP ligase [Xanthomonas sp. D-109]|uniref:fatty acyl-AMP ligase n=1 Tax=Xanthomonas sp. D-109 TaxID=2821274 RepID=UPI001AD9DE53|nr:fatty acyl-AMP ligase [Xanthomonas sp. D-109]MBO9883279.1 fatty acyl-AMP ligase [Xanthomonas sp. D-109]
MAWFPEIVALRARTEPQRLAYRFQHGRLEPQTLTFAELWHLSSTLAQQMVQHGWRGTRALLVCRQERSFVIAFYACLLSGVVAVPTAVPRRQALHERLGLLAHDAQVGAILSDFDEMLQSGFRSEAGDLPMLDVRAVVADLACGFVLPPFDASDPAFLQYTSGSTGDPKGVVVSHANLIDNSECIRRSMDISADSSVLIGLPLFHDMGLVGGVLQSMYAGCTTTFLPPAELVQYPERWLQLISRLRITTSGGPNYMYALAAEHIPDLVLEDLDLSCWKVAFCGAEPIRASTMERFCSRFAPAGFRPGAFYPCYGMAEATLFIAGGQVGEQPRSVRRDAADVVCCGQPADGTQVCIVNVDTCRPVADGEIGEIWVSGPSVALGYWGREALTASIFQASLAGDSSGAWLRTGDLGWLQAGSLYVSGRLKDLIILNGRKYVPQDIESAIEESVPAIRRGAVAAFAVADDGGERAVIVAELEREWWRKADAWPHFVNAARAAIRNAQGPHVEDIVFIRPGALPRTSSGKLRRSQCRSDYLSGRLHALPADAPA